MLDPEYESEDALQRELGELGRKVLGLIGRR
jgi:hypothetical protein